MRSAHRELVLSIFRCDDFGVIDELASAVKRGVQVRILITRRARGWRAKLKDLTALLQSAGAEVVAYENPRVKYHAKYVVADDGPALVTSLNFTRKCFEATSDFLVFTSDPKVVSGLKALFQKDCAASTTAVHLPVPATERLIIGPEDSRLRLTQMLSGAATSIRIIDHRVTDLDILNLLAAKRDKGVTVQVLGNGSLGGLIPHGRMILIDEKTAIIGSIRLARPSLDLRREVAIVVEDANVAAELYDYFQNLAMNEGTLVNLWAAAPPASSEDDDDDEDE
jgi:phosphatidylserine/phosphatidylglycerophosphate/cardiolipin synthase-like enzyme